MKKITAIILSLVMVLMMLPVHGSEAEAIADSAAVETVKAFGFMNGYPDGTFRSEKPVTRAEFACIITNLMNFNPDVSDGEATPFSDVTASHWASPYVNIVNNQGLMRGYGDGKFMPEKNITVVEATKVMITLMGYGYFAEAKGGWPTGYQVQANELDLLDGINGNINAPITRGEMAQLLCASFDVDIYIPDGYGEDVSIRREEGVTILSKYHDIYNAEGIVTANRFTAVNGKSGIRDNEVEIDGERYYTDIDVSNYLGYNVKIYYREEDANTRTIVSMEDVNTQVMALAPEAIGGIDGYKINYFNDNNKEKSIKIESNTNIVINNEFDGRAVNFDLDTLSEVNGTIKFINNDSDAEYEVIIIKNYTVGVVEGVNAPNERINFKWNVEGLNLEDSKYVIYRGDKEISISDINASEVLCIAASKGFSAGERESAVEIVASDKSVNGKVVAISDNGVIIENKDGKAEYKVSSYYISEKGNIISIGDNGNFYLDMNGKIVSCLQGEVGMKWGYLIDADMKEGMSSIVQLKILTSAGTVDVYTVKEKVRLDGDGISAEKMYEELANMVEGEYISMMIRYSVNAEGLVTAIDTEERNSDNDPDELKIEDVNIAGGMRYQSMGTLLVSYYDPHRYVIGSDVAVFAIPDAGSDDDEYKVYNNTYFVNEKYYGDVAKGQSMSMCNVKDSIPAAVVIKAGAAATNLGTISLPDGPSAVIKNKVLTMDDDGTEYTKLILDSKGTEVELIVTEKTALLFTNGSNNVSDKLPGSTELLTIDDYNFGDIVMFDKGNKNKANVLLRINDYKVSDLEHGEYQVSGMSGYTEFIMGSVRKKTGTVLELDVSTDPNLVINALRNPTVTLVEERTKKVTSSTLDEIWASESDPEADKIFARVRFGNVAEIYIYR